MKILCLFVQYGSKAYPKALTQLNDWYQRHHLLDKRILWILDNSLGPEEPFVKMPDGSVLLPGDNTSWEFSAWEKGWQEFSNQGLECSHVHFVTSAFNTLYTGYLEHFDNCMLDYVIANNVCLGHIDFYDREIRIAKKSSSSWIRTGFFFLPWGLARDHFPGPVWRNKEEFFESDSARVFRENAPLDEYGRRRIIEWLQGEELGGHSWHSPIGVGCEETLRFQSKTLAILNEHSFSISLCSHNVPLVDFFWLYHEIQGMMKPASPPPAVCEQLRYRNSFLGRPI